MYISIAHSCGVSGPKKLCGCVVQPAGPAAAKLRSCRATVCAPRSDYSRRSPANASMVGEFQRIGSSSRSTSGFTIGPMIRPINLRGGRIWRGASSRPPAQCAITCAAFIFPHSRSLSGVNRSARSLNSVATEGSNRFFKSQALCGIISALSMESSRRTPVEKNTSQGRFACFRRLRDNHRPSPQPIIALPGVFNRGERHGYRVDVEFAAGCQ